MVIYLLNQSQHLCWLCIGSCSYWTAVYTWSANIERLWRPQDEQIRQPGVNVQVGSVFSAVCFILVCTPCTVHTSKNLCFAAVGSTCVGRPRLRAPASPLVTAAGLDSSAQLCGSLMQLSMRQDSTSAPTRTWRLKMAKLQQLLMCLSGVNSFYPYLPCLDMMLWWTTFRVKLETESDQIVLWIAFVSTLLWCVILGASIGRCSMSVTVVIYSDYKVPFVPLEKEHEVVFIREGERVVIPCRGSVEDLNVTLHTVRKSSFCSPWSISFAKKKKVKKGHGTMWKEQHFLLMLVFWFVSNMPNKP